jgi:hypothetical protein
MSNAAAPPEAATGIQSMPAGLVACAEAAALNTNVQAMT